MVVVRLYPKGLFDLCYKLRVCQNVHFSVRGARIIAGTRGMLLELLQQAHSLASALMRERDTDQPGDHGCMGLLQQALECRVR